jgi:hypothetical protein
LTDLFLFEVLGVGFGVRCCDGELQRLVQANWAYFATPATHDDPVLFDVTRSSPPTFSWTCSNGAAGDAYDTCALLYALEHAVVIELQTRRSDLYFLHAAAAERHGRAYLLVAASGSGKSTTQWALLHHGFGYLSDELAPIELNSLNVHAYPHALCLKQPPPPPYGLPTETLATERTLHVPVTNLPRLAEPGPRPVGAAIFLAYRPQAMAPSMHPISPGETSARLYANSLNPLAHPNAGLAAAARIAASVPGFVVESADLCDTCQLIEATLDRLV